MTSLPKHLLSLLLLASISLPTLAQDKSSFNTMGLDLEVLSYGGSFGGFYAFHPTPAVSLEIESDWALVESNDSFTYYDYYYYQPVQINNRNLSFFKVTGGATWFPFLDSMHPSLQVGFFLGGGPLVAFNTADDEPFFQRWKAVETSVTPMLRSGIQLRVLTGQGGSYNFKLGYDYASFDQVIDTQKDYKGLFFQAGWEFIHR